MDEWHVGDPEDWGDSVGVPDIPYMGYLQNDEDDDERPPRRPSRVNQLREEAWQLYQDYRSHEALLKINEALEYSNHWRLLNIKAIILEDLGDEEEALRFYDMAMQRSEAQIVRDNKARLLERIAWSRKCSNDHQKALDMINEALRLTGDEEDRKKFFGTKRNILSLMGRKREAYVCNMLANERPEMVDEFESQSKILKNTRGTLICIAGREHYGYAAPTNSGAVVDLIKEPDNEHDSDAIRVEYQKMTVGYVANSPYTLIDEAKSSSQIGGLFERSAKAKILFVFMQDYLLAEMI